MNDFDKKTPCKQFVLQGVFYIAINNIRKSEKPTHTDKECD